MKGTPGGAAGVVVTGTRNAGGGSGKTIPTPGVNGKGATTVPGKPGGGAFFTGGGATTVLGKTGGGAFFAGGGAATVPEGSGGGLFTGTGADTFPGTSGGGAFFALTTGGKPGGGAFGFLDGIAFTGMSGEELFSLTGMGGT